MTIFPHSYLGEKIPVQSTHYINGKIRFEIFLPQLIKWISTDAVKTSSWKYNRNLFGHYRNDTRENESWPDISST